MPENLFCGKNLLSGAWVQGNLVTSPNGEKAVIVTYSEDGEGCRYFEYTPVEPKSIGVFTGLYDLNGNKIFTGDIVTFEDAEADCEGYHDNVFLNRGVVFFDPWSGICFSKRQVVDMDDLYESQTVVACEVVGKSFDEISSTIEVVSEKDNILKKLTELLE